jgi:hypothetical protein
MTQTYDRGAICSVPALGPSARCLLLSSVRGEARGRPEYQVAPLYSSLPYEAGQSEAFIESYETTLGVRLIAALWNVRPLLASDLGEQLGVITRDAVLSDLRDAFLRLADPSMRVAPGRVGTAEVPEYGRAWRAGEIGAWQPLTGRALAPDFAPHASFEKEAQFQLRVVRYAGAAAMSCQYKLLSYALDDWATLDVMATEQNLGREDVIMVGVNEALLRLADVYATRQRLAKVAEHTVPYAVDVVTSKSVRQFGGRLGELTRSKEAPTDLSLLEFA